MPKFMKGNYKIADKKDKKNVTTKAKKKDLTARFEESAMAKLGGSLCFVMKANNFVWEGNEGEEPGKKTR